MELSFQSPLPAVNPLPHASQGQVRSPGGRRGERSQKGTSAQRFDKFALLDRLEAIRTDGNFAFFDSFEPTDCEITVKGVGLISTPLSAAQAKQIIAQSHLATYGRGNRTVVDTAARNPWGLDPNQFEIGNQRWQHHLDGILARVAKGLGITEPIHAELDKMLIYEKGAMFKSQGDAEKIPRMFGTLVVSLPSLHTGGEVIVKHNHKMETFQTCHHEMSYLSWYSDTSHEILPVTSGYRWVLTYNLAMTPAENKSEPPSSYLLEHEQELRKILVSWAEEVKAKRRAETPLYYKLEHKYSEANLSLNALKLNDRARVSLLQKICSDLRFDLVLATLEKEEHRTTELRPVRYKRKHKYNGYKKRKYEKYDCSRDDYDSASDYGDEDDHSDNGAYRLVDRLVKTTHSARLILDLKGRRITSSVQIDEGEIIQEDPFEDEPDSETHENYMGNSVPKATDLYQSTALVIIPPEGALSYLAKDVRSGMRPLSKTKSSNLMDFFLNRCIDYPGDVTCLKESNCLMMRILDYPFFPLDDDILQKSLQVFINMPVTFYFIVRRSTLPVPLSFFSWLRAEYDKSNIPLKTLEQGFLRALVSLRGLSHRCEAINVFIGDMETPTELESVISRAVDETLKITEYARLYDTDGLAYFDLSLYHKGFEYLQSTVVPMRRQNGRTGFMLGFLKRLLQSIRCHQVPREEAESIYRQLSLFVVDTVKYYSLKVTEVPKVKGGTSRQRFEVPVTAEPDYLTYDSFFGFICSFFQFDLKTHMVMFLWNVPNQASLIEGDSFHMIWLPLLVDLFAEFERYDANLSAPGWRGLYISILSAYLYNYVRLRPVNQAPVQKRVNCRKAYCEDCRALNTFLANDSETTTYFPVSKQRRHHIHSQLDSIISGCTHETDRHGSRETLVVTKVNTAQTALRNWTERRRQALKHLAVFDQGKLRILLGEMYEGIMNMTILEPIQVTYAPPPPAYPPQQRAVHSRPRPVAAPPPADPEQELARVEAEIRRLAQSSAPNTRPPPARPPPSTHPASWQAPAPSFAPPQPQPQPQRPTLPTPRAQSHAGMPLCRAAPQMAPPPSPVFPRPPTRHGSGSIAPPLPLPLPGERPPQPQPQPQTYMTAAPPPIALAPIATPSSGPAAGGMTTTTTTAREGGSVFSRPSYDRRMPGLVAGVKRKAAAVDVIDLTGDDTDR
ncbi:hypothetical protein F4809DRAFT_441552 [Biscogniauxia mediterranea]|nr:hypothetical protein F4809DRAFT_441552 [Biscogniauxia mediterranea]